MRQVTGSIALLGSGGVALAQKQEASDSDRYIADQPGQGRGPVTGITDTDPGDSVGNGRGNTMRRGDLNPERPPRSPFQETNDREAGTGITDNDPTDRVGYGRSRPPERPPQNPYTDTGQQRRAGTGVTDSDPTDPVGFGTGRPQGTRRCTDSDVGNNADRSGEGRNC
jgi:hypothetical protein